MLRYAHASADAPGPSVLDSDQYRDLQVAPVGYDDSPAAAAAAAWGSPVSRPRAYVGSDCYEHAAMVLPPPSAGSRSAASKKQAKAKKKQPQRMSIVPNLKLMSNSERGKYYRRRKKMHTEELERDVAELREQVAALSVSRQVQRELAVSATRTPFGSSARLVVEYCQQFAHGAPVRLAVNESDATASLVSKATVTQSGFLRAVMESDVRFGEFAGIDLLLDQWERYSIYHSSISWQLRSLEVARTSELLDCADSDELASERAPVVIAIHADLTVRFSHRTIEEVFPHLLGDEPLIQELVGLEVTYPCINHFHFNHRGKIEWYNPEVDFVAALLRALGSVERVDRVLGHALIAKDHMIGEIEPDLPHGGTAQGEELESRVVHVVEDEDSSKATAVVPDVPGNQEDEDMDAGKPQGDEDAPSLPGQMNLAFILN